MRALSSAGVIRPANICARLLFKILGKAVVAPGGAQRRGRAGAVAL